MAQTITISYKNKTYTCNHQFYVNVQYSTPGTFRDYYTVSFVDTVCHSLLVDLRDTQDTFSMTVCYFVQGRKKSEDVYNSCRVTEIKEVSSDLHDAEFDFQFVIKGERQEGTKWLM